MTEQASLGGISEEEKGSVQESEEYFRFSIPSDWEVRPMSKIGDVQGGSTPDTGKEEYWDGDIPWLTPTEVTESRKIEISETGRNITEEGYESTSTHLMPENSLLLTTRATIGSALINKVPMCTNQGFQNIEPEDDVNTLYLYYQVRHASDYLDSLGSGSTFNEISKSMLKNVELPVPEISEQRRIASVLYNVDRAIQKTEEIIEQTQRVKKGLMQELFAEGYRNHEETMNTPIGKVPKNWELKNISEIGKIINGSTFPEEEQGKSEGVPFIKVSDTNKTSKYASYAENFITEERADEINVRILPENSIILPKRGAAILTNKRRILPQKSAIDNNQIGVHADKISNFYLYHYLCTVDMERYAQKGAVHSLNKSTLAKIKVPVPEEKEQEKIAETLNSVDEEISQLKEEKEQLQRLKKGLMQDLLTGEVRTSEGVEVLDEVVEVEADET